MAIRVDVAGDERPKVSPSLNIYSISDFFARYREGRLSTACGLLMIYFLLPLSRRINYCALQRRVIEGLS